MPFNEKTGIYTSHLPDAQLPSNLDTLSIYDFLFGPLYTPKGKGAVIRSKREGAVWLIDSVSGRTLTYEQAHERTLDLARGFAKRGLANEDTLVVFSPNEVDYATAIWAGFRLGAVASCANPSYNASELSYQLGMVHKHHPVKIVLVSPDSLPDTLQACEKSGLPESKIILIRSPSDSSTDEVKKLAKGFPTLDDVAKEGRGFELPKKPELKPKGLAFLSFSSGTTGLPKAVCIPHRALISNVLQASLHWQETTPWTRYDPKTKKGDVIAGVLPFFHIYGLVVVLHISVYNNTPVCVIPKFQLEPFLATIQKYKITCLYLVPPIVILLTKSEVTKNYDLSSVRIGMAGAAPLTNETYSALCRKFPKWTFGQGYGMTESCTIITMYDPIAEGGSPGASAGVLSPNIEIKIVSPDGKLLPPNGVGELWSRSPSNALAYLANEKATNETWDQDGFLHTGDECYICPKGFMYVVDRIKELIKVSGNQVAPAELEGFLLDHPLVNDACVIGIPDDYTGEKPKAFIALPPTEQEKLSKDPKLAKEYAASIMKHVADNKIKYKHLTEVEFLAAIPKTASGKLLRKDRKLAELVLIHALRLET